MSIFSDKELEEYQNDNLNKILPEEFRKDTWKISDFKGSDSIYERYDSILQAKKTAFIKFQEKLEEKHQELDSVYIRNIIIFNTELYEAKPLGMVDIGLVERFGAQSSGDRFAAGAIGYAIETAADDTFAKSNAQEKAVNKTKYELLKKARQVYPDCNQLFKFQVDFRELGSSGNVFIYMRGTAAIGKNDQMAKKVQEKKEEISLVEDQLKNMKKEIEEMQETKSKIPENKKEIESKLG